MPPPVVQPAAESQDERAGNLAYFQCVQADAGTCYEKFLQEHPNHSKAAQVETLLRAKAELPRYQACVDGNVPSERLRLCDLYLNAFPNGKYKDEAKTLRDQAMLDVRSVPTTTQAPSVQAPVAPPPIQSLPPTQVSPSFPCARARIPAEIAVCNSALLAGLDVQLNALYAQALVGNPSVKAQQRSWIDLRNACGSDAACIEQRYREQIGGFQGSPTPASAATPSFPCARASLPAEVAICNSALLAGLDVQLNDLYSRAKRGKRAQYYVGRQRSWMDQRNACGSDSACLEQRYREQIRFLQGAG